MDPVKYETSVVKYETSVLKYETLSAPERPSLDLSPGMSRIPSASDRNLKWFQKQVGSR
jgi:hypothetical protein